MQPRRAASFLNSPKWRYPGAPLVVDAPEGETVPPPAYAGDWRAPPTAAALLYYTVHWRDLDEDISVAAQPHRRGVLVVDPGCVYLAAVADGRVLREIPIGDIGSVAVRVGAEGVSPVLSAAGDPRGAGRHGGTTHALPVATSCEWGHLVLSLNPRLGGSGEFVWFDTPLDDGWNSGLGPGDVVSALAGAARAQGRPGLHVWVSLGESEARFRERLQGAAQQAAASLLMLPRLESLGAIPYAVETGADDDVSTMSLQKAVAAGHAAGGASRSTRKMARPPRASGLKGSPGSPRRAKSGTGRVRWEDLTPTLGPSGAPVGSVRAPANTPRTVCAPTPPTQCVEPPTAQGQPGAGDTEAVTATAPSIPTAVTTPPAALVAQQQQLQREDEAGVDRRGSLSSLHLSETGSMTLPPTAAEAARGRERVARADKVSTPDALESSGEGDGDDSRAPLPAPAVGGLVSPTATTKAAKPDGEKRHGNHNENRNGGKDEVGGGFGRRQSGTAMILSGQTASPSSSPSPTAPLSGTAVVIRGGRAPDKDAPVGVEEAQPQRQRHRGAPPPYAAAVAGGGAAAHPAGRGPPRRRSTSSTRSSAPRPAAMSDILEVLEAEIAPQASTGTLTDENPTARRRSRTHAGNGRAAAPTAQRFSKRGGGPAPLVEDARDGKSNDKTCRTPERRGGHASASPNRLAPPHTERLAAQLAALDERLKASRSPPRESRARSRTHAHTPTPTPTPTYTSESGAGTASSRRGGGGRGDRTPDRPTRRRGPQGGGDAPAYGGGATPDSERLAARLASLNGKLRGSRSPERGGRGSPPPPASPARDRAGGGPQPRGPARRRGGRSQEVPGKDRRDRDRRRHRTPSPNGGRLEAQLAGLDGKLRASRSPPAQARDTHGASPRTRGSTRGLAPRPSRQDRIREAQLAQLAAMEVSVPSTWSSYHAPTGRGGHHDGRRRREGSATPPPPAHTPTRAQQSRSPPPSDTPYGGRQGGGGGARRTPTASPRRSRQRSPRVEKARARGRGGRDEEENIADSIADTRMSGAASGVSTTPCSTVARMTRKLADLDGRLKEERGSAGEEGAGSSDGSRSRSGGNRASRKRGTSSSGKKHRRRATARAREQGTPRSLRHRNADPDVDAHADADADGWEDTSSSPMSRAATDISSFPRVESGSGASALPPNAVDGVGVSDVESRGSAHQPRTTSPHAGRDTEGEGLERKAVPGATGQRRTRARRAARGSDATLTDATTTQEGTRGGRNTEREPPRDERYLQSAGGGRAAVDAAAGVPEPHRGAASPPSSPPALPPQPRQRPPVTTGTGVTDARVPDDAAYLHPVRGIVVGDGRAGGAGDGGPGRAATSPPRATPVPPAFAAGASAAPMRGGGSGAKATALYSQVPAVRRGVNPGRPTRVRMVGGDGAHYNATTGSADGYWGLADVALPQTPDTRHPGVIFATPHRLVVYRSFGDDTAPTPHDGGEVDPADPGIEVLSCDTRDIQCITEYRGLPDGLGRAFSVTTRHPPLHTSTSTPPWDVLVTTPHTPDLVDAIRRVLEDGVPYDVRDVDAPTHAVGSGSGGGGGNVRVPAVLTLRRGAQQQPQRRLPRTKGRGAAGMGMASPNPQSGGGKNGRVVRGDGDPWFADQVKAQAQLPRAVNAAGPASITPTPSFGVDLPMVRGHTAAAAVGPSAADRSPERGGGGAPATFDHIHDRSALEDAQRELNSALARHRGGVVDGPGPQFPMTTQSTPAATTTTTTTTPATLHLENDAHRHPRHHPVARGAAAAAPANTPTRSRGADPAVGVSGMLSHHTRSLSPARSPRRLQSPLGTDGPRPHAHPGRVSPPPPSRGAESTLGGGGVGSPPTAQGAAGARYSRPDEQEMPQQQPAAYPMGEGSAVAHHPRVADAGVPWDYLQPQPQPQPTPHHKRAVPPPVQSPTTRASGAVSPQQSHVGVNYKPPPHPAAYESVARQLGASGEYEHEQERDPGPRGFDHHITTPYRGVLVDSPSHTASQGVGAHDGWNKGGNVRGGGGGDAAETTPYRHTGDQPPTVVVVGSPSNEPVWSARAQRQRASGSGRKLSPIPDGRARRAVGRGTPVTVPRTWRQAGRDGHGNGPVASPQTGGTIPRSTRFSSSPHGSPVRTAGGRMSPAPPGSIRKGGTHVDTSTRLSDDDGDDDDSDPPTPSPSSPLHFDSDDDASDANDGVAAAAARPPAHSSRPVDPRGIADALHTAMSGFGTDEDAIYTQLGRIDSPATWNAVKDAFRSKHKEYQKGDVVAALKDELTGKEFAEAEGVLKRRGVALEAGRIAGGGSASKLDPRGVADVLHKAMNGFGTDEDAIYTQLGGVRSREEWDAVRNAFRSKYKKFHKGNVVAALKDELTGRQYAKAEGVLKRNGIALDAQRAGGPDSRGRADPRGMADALHKAMSGFGTDEDAIYTQLGRVDSKPTWKAVKDAFRIQHPKFHEGDVVAALKDELTGKEYAKAEGILKRNGVPIGDEQASASKAPDPRGIADTLHKAMSGFGTDEDAIYTQLGGVTSQGMWEDVKNTFRAKHKKFHKGDVVAALKDELTGKEYAKAEGVLGRNGVQMRAQPPQQHQPASAAAKMAAKQEHGVGGYRRAGTVTWGDADAPSPDLSSPAASDTDFPGSPFSGDVVVLSDGESVGHADALHTRTTVDGDGLTLTLPSAGDGSEEADELTATVLTGGLLPQRRTASASRGESTDYAARLTALFEAHSPEDVPRVPKLLAKHEGREERLIQAMVAKLGPEPEPDAHGDTPRRRRGGAASGEVSDRRTEEVLRRQQAEIELLRNELARAQDVAGSAHADTSGPLVQSGGGFESTVAQGEEEGVHRPHPQPPPGRAASGTPAAHPSPTAILLGRAPALPAPAATPAEYRTRVKALMARYDPAKTSSALDTLARKPGKEEQVIQALVKKYGPEPTGTPSTRASSSGRATPVSCVHSHASAASSAAALPPAISLPLPPGTHRERVAVLMARYDPGRTGWALGLLSKKPGQEEQVIQMLVKKYGPEPTAAVGTPSTASRGASTSLGSAQQLAAGADGNYRDRVAALMNRYDPGRTDWALGMLAKKPGKEEQVMKILVQKYGPEPTATPATTSREDSTSVSSAQHQQLAAGADGNYRERVAALMARYDPGRTGWALNMLASKPGKEERVIRSLVTKYGPEPTAAHETGTGTAETTPSAASKGESSSQATAQGLAARTDGNYRDRVAALMNRYDPGRTDWALGMLAKKPGKEEQVMKMLVQKYGPELDVATSSLPATPHAANEGGGTGTSQAPMGIPSFGAPTPATPASPVAAVSPQSEASAPTARAVPADGGGYRARVVALMNHYDPGKMDWALGMLAKKPGKEEQVVQQLVRKYGPEPAAGVDMTSPAAAHHEQTPNTGTGGPTFGSPVTFGAGLSYAAPQEADAIASRPATDEPRAAPAAPAGTEGTEGTVDSDAYRDRLTAFMNHYDPGKTEWALGMLANKPGKEEQVIQQMVRKYGPEPGAVPSEGGAAMAAPTGGDDPTAAAETPAAATEPPVPTTAAGFSFGPPSGAAGVAFGAGAAGSGVDPSDAGAAGVFSFGSPTQAAVGGGDSDAGGDDGGGGGFTFGAPATGGGFSFANPDPAADTGSPTPPPAAGGAVSFGAPAAVTAADAPASAPADPPTGDDAHRARLTALMNHYDPGKTEWALGMLANKPGKEEQVIQQMVRKYGPEP